MLGIRECVADARGDRLGDVLVEEEPHESGCRVDVQSLLPLRGEGEAFEHVFVGQLWDLAHGCGFGHASREVSEHFPNGDERSAHARLAKADVWISGDAGERRHILSVPRVSLGRVGLDTVQSVNSRTPRSCLQITNRFVICKNLDLDLGGSVFYDTAGDVYSPADQRAAQILWDRRRPSRREIDERPAA